MGSLKSLIYLLVAFKKKKNIIVVALSTSSLNLVYTFILDSSFVYLSQIIPYSFSLIKTISIFDF